MLVVIFNPWFNRHMNYEDAAELNRNKTIARNHIFCNWKAEMEKQPNKPVILTDLPANRFLLVSQMWAYLTKYRKDQQHTFFLFEANRTKYNSRCYNDHAFRPFKIEKEGWLIDFPELREELGDEYFEANQFATVHTGKHKNVTFFYICAFMTVPVKTKGRLMCQWLDYCNGPVKANTEQTLGVVKRVTDSLTYVTYLAKYRRGGPNESPWNYHSLLRRFGLGQAHSNRAAITKFIMKQVEDCNIELVTSHAYLGGCGNGTNMVLLGLRSHGRIKTCKHLQHSVA